MMAPVSEAISQLPASFQPTKKSEREREIFELILWLYMIRHLHVPLYY